MNLIIFSDHGMTNMDRSKVINITDVLTSEPNLYIYVYESGAVASIYVPNEVAADKVRIPFSVIDFVLYLLIIIIT